MADRFANHPVSLEGPMEDGVVVVPSDTIDLVQSTRGIWVGATGNVAVMHYNRANTRSVVTYAGVPAGTLLRVRALRVMAANTTATAMLACW